MFDASFCPADALQQMADLHRQLVEKRLAVRHAVCRKVDLWLEVLCQLLVTRAISNYWSRTDIAAPIGRWRIALARRRNGLSARSSPTRTTSPVLWMSWN
jgi:hypothetical protein